MQKNTNTSINTNNYANYLGKTLFEWEIDELKIRERTKRWYIVAISFALLMLLFSFMTANFEFKNVLRPRLSISLENMDPLTIRESLLKYLPEDLERTNRPLSEELASLFRL